ncbi:MAG: hypothetical protein IPM54_03755 [Polyangiaceae bacterium]|nr:hypothetical protein [Polyangiaceae bacterium]
MQRRPLLAQRILTGFLVLLPALAGCGPADSPNPGTPVDELLAPPPEGQGIQLSMKATIAPGVEGEWCQFVKAPAEALFVNRDEVRYTKGSHHFLLYETTYTEIPTKKENGTVVDTTGVFDCSDGATNGWSVTKLVGGSQNADGTSIVRFPEGVAMPVKAGAVLLMNAHYVNATSEVLEPEVRINLHTIPESEVKQEGDILFMYNAFIHVPQMGSSRARMRCQVHKDITIQNVQSHMHARGTGYEALEVGGTPFYTNEQWADVPVKDFDGGLSLKAGTWIDYACDYKNAEARDVYQGPRSTDEMCMLIGSYYPADPATAHCSLDVTKPLETGNLGAEWVGDGSATCAQTLGCIQQNFGPNFNLEGFTQCVTGSDPAVSREMSDVVQCIITSGNPMVDCKTQIDACAAK